MFCTALKKITVGQMTADEGTELNHYCFYGCTALEELNLGQGVWHFGEYNFKDCVSLKSVTLAEDMHDLISNNFAGCTSLSEIKIADTNQWMASEDGVMYKTKDAYDRSYIIEPALLTVPDGKIKAMGGNYTVVKGTMSIERGAFDSAADLKNATVASTVQLIGQEAFSNCRNLKSVAIPKAVTSIGDNAFSYFIQPLTSSIFNYSDNVQVSSSLTDIYYEGSETDWKNITYAKYKHSANVDTIVVTARGSLYDHLDVVGLSSNVVIHYNSAIQDTENTLGVFKTGEYKITKNTSAIALPVKAKKIEVELESGDTFTITGDNKKGITINKKKKLLSAKKVGTYVLSIKNSKGEERQVTIYVEKPVLKKYIASDRNPVSITKMLSGVTKLRPTEFKSTKESVAVVSGAGMITPVGKGTTKIIVTFGPKKYKAKFKVTV